MLFCARHIACLVEVNGFGLLPQCGWTVVHFAAYNGHLEMLQELLERFNCEADKRDKKVGLLGDNVSPLGLLHKYTHMHAHTQTYTHTLSQ